MTGEQLAVATKAIDTYMESFPSKDLSRVAVCESVFSTLHYEIQDDTEVAYKNVNIPEMWHIAFRILTANDATIIVDAYYREGYKFVYWLVGEDKIYRSRLSGTER